MSNELRYFRTTGLTVTCQVRQLDGTAEGSAIALTENGSTGIYYGDFPTVAAGVYDLTFFESAVAKVVGTVEWNGTTILGYTDTVTATGFSTFNATTDEVTTDLASRTASQADVSALSTQASVDALPTASAIATAVWTAATRTLTFAASAPSVSEIWEYASRTLTSVQSVPASGTLGTRLEIYNHTTYTNTWSGLNIPADWKEIYFTAKSDPALEADTDSTLMVKVSRVSAVGDGLVYLNGASSPLVGTLTIDQGAGTVKLDLSKAVCAELLVGCPLYYDVKLVNDDDTDQFLILPSLVTIKPPVKR